MRSLATKAALRGVILTVAVLLGAAMLTGCPHQQSSNTGGNGSAKKYSVGIVQVASHPLLDAVREGFVGRLSELGYKDGDNVHYDVQNAQGEMTNAQTIVQKFVSEQVSLIFPIGTSPSQAAAKATRDIPIVFGAVTDPVSAGLVKDPQHPGWNITGVSDLSPFKAQLELLKKVAPTVKVVGMVYNPGEANSAFGVAATRKAAEGLGMTVKTASITSTSEVSSAAQSIADQVDAFYSGTDNTVVSALEALIKVAEARKKPLLAADPDSVQRGALITLGVDYKQVGIDSANLADKILKGASPGSLPVVYAPGTVLAVNKAAAASEGVTIPPDLLQKATKVFDKKEQPKKP